MSVHELKYGFFYEHATTDAAEKLGKIVHVKASTSLVCSLKFHLACISLHYIAAKVLTCI